MMKTSEIRNRFLEFFEKRGHQRMPSSSLIPQDDPTLLFTNAGMVQFKRIFTGEEKRPYVRAVSSQKCVRAGGKHNDLENVGYTARHHTFFEMLGNFSFGDYFKQEAIEFAWDLLLNEYKLPEEKLYATIYQDDDEAHGLWRKITGIPENRIYRLGEEDNFWSMGDVGPCGPCSEILIDQGQHIGCQSPNCAPGCDCDRFLEIWNLVFMQFEKTADGQMIPLPKPSIDTGMGLERLAAVSQKVISNFETDLFTPLIERVVSLSGIPYIYGRELRENDENFQSNVSTRVIADHAKAVVFLINDGIRPENLGRGYVLRRILRRAVRHGRKLGLDKSFLAEISEVVIKEMQSAFPEIAKNASYIKEIISNEEERFSETLGAGLQILNEAIADLKKDKEKIIDGQTAFKLYDTYGFPVDLVADVAREHSLTVDEKGFEVAMEKQRTLSRASWKGGLQDDALMPLVNTLTASGFKSEFVGYNLLVADEEVKLLIKDNKIVKEAKEGDEVILVFEKTPFYAVSGGQEGDVGEIHFSKALVEIYEVRKAPGTEVILHIGEVKTGFFKAEEKAKLKVNELLRLKTAKNHSATHLLHKALRVVLGDQVRQAGSLVNAERLRFDFSHSSALNKEELYTVEQLVNKAIGENYNIVTNEMNMDDAVESGAMALFEERYGEKVRVLSIGDYSKELCGGTHAKFTGQIGSFVITEESSVAAGVRRLECLTGEEAFKYLHEQRLVLNALSSLFKVKPEFLLQRVEASLSKIKELEKELKENISSANSLDVKGLAQEAKKIGDIKLLVKEVVAFDPKNLREIGDQLKDILAQKSVIALASKTQDEKAMLLVIVSKDLTEKYKAGLIVAKMAEALGGKGGGRADMAQAGGPEASKISESLEVAKSFFK